MLWIAGSTLLGGVLLLAGLPKLRDRAGMLIAVQGYRLLPAAAERLVAAVLPLLEVGLGALLVLGLGAPWVPAAATVLFLVFFLALSFNLLRGRRDLDCGCFTFAAPQGTVPRIGWFHAGRALVLTGMAAVLAWSGPEHGFGETSVQDHMLGAAAAGLVLALGVAVAALRPVLNPGRRSVDSHLSDARRALAQSLAQR